MPHPLGIDPAFSLGQRVECWFCKPSLRQWAIEHVAERHGVPVSEVVVIRVKLPRNQLTFRWPGVFTCPRVVRSLMSVAVPAVPAPATA